MHKNNKIKICNICGKKVAFNALSSHLKNHKISAKDYYIQWLLKPTDILICPICNKPTKFISLENGFDIVCSNECRIKSIDKTNKLQCQICGNICINYNGLGYHLKYCHNILTNQDKKQYYDKYLKQDIESICKRCGKETKFISIKKGYPRQFCSTYCSNRYMFDNESIEHKNNRIQKSVIAYKNYRQNMTAEQKEIDHISHVNAQKNRSLEDKEKTSQKLKNIAANRNTEEKNKIYNKMINTRNSRSNAEKELEKKNRSAGVKKRWKTITYEDKQKFIKNCKQSYWNNTINKIDNINNKRRNSRSIFMKNKPSYNGVYFDSLWELNIYKYCIVHNIPIKREPVSIPYQFQNKHFTTFPDFEIDGILVEIKGKQFVKNDGTWYNPYLTGDDKLNDNSEAKHQAMINANVKIWYEKDVNAFLNGSLEVLYE